jgi:uncharacterized membrane protein
MTEQDQKPNDAKPAAQEPAHDPWAFLTTPIYPRKTIMKHIRGRLFAGLLYAIPLFITIFIIAAIYSLVTKFTQDPAEWITTKIFGLPADPLQPNWKRVWVVEPVIAVSISIFIVYFLGLLGGFVVGRRLLAAGEHFISNLPLIKGIYGTTKQVIGVFRQGAGGQNFQRVVLVEFPRVGTWTVGFVTKTITDTSTGDVFACVFIPMTPNPTSGFFQLFPNNSVRDTDWTVDQGIKIVLSGGLLAPSQLQFDCKRASDSQETP